MAKRSHSGPLLTLRRKAEELLKKGPERILGSPRDRHELAHELSVYGIELEMQNEELRRSHEALEESRALYHDLYENAPVGYLTLNHKGLVSALNLTAARLLGIERSFALNKPLTAFITRDSQDAFYLHRRKVLETAGRHTCELVLKRRDGSVFDAQLESISVVVDGSPTVRSVLTDITERKRVEEELEGHRKSELAYLASFPERNPNPIIEADLAGTVHYVNPTAERLFPDLKAAGSSHPWLSDLESMTGRFSERVKVIRREVNMGESWYGQTVHYIAETGRVRIYGTDITVRKRIEEELGKAKEDLQARIGERTEELQKAYGTLLSETTQRRKAEEQLDQSQKMEAIGTFAGGIAHDFNNMLAVIMGNAEMLFDDLDDGANGAKHQIGQILTASKRARDLVKQILTFSRKSERQRKALALAPLVEETAKLLRGSLPSTIGIELEVNIDSDTILADPSQIQQVLMNLASNAAHAMREDGGTLTINLSETVFAEGDPMPDRVMRAGRYVKLSVSDTGTGMPEKIRDRIFEPFFTTKAPGEGTGMGLSVVFGIVKSHEGAITVESRAGKGSTFNLFFPASLPSIQEEAPEGSPFPRGKERILVVDDEATVAEIASETLERLGYKVTTAPGGPEGWNTFEDDPRGFDLVITDHVMPGLTGMRLAERMLTVRKDLPVILFTGYSETVSLEKAKAAGISEFLLKPVEKRELAEKVRRVLDYAGAQQRLSDGNHGPD